MPRSRRFSSQRTSGANRRQSSWAVGPEGLVASVVTSSVNAFPATAVAALAGLTIIRTRGELLVYLTGAGGAKTEGFRYGFGMCVVSENAAGVGITAIPAPITDIAWDGWFVYETGTIAQMFTGLGEASPTQSSRIVIDSKAMRKIKQSDVIVGVIEFDEQGDGAEISANLSTRMLLKLS